MFHRAAGFSILSRASGLSHAPEVPVRTVSVSRGGEDAPPEADIVTRRGVKLPIQWREKKIRRDRRSSGGAPPSLVVILRLLASGIALAFTLA